MNTVRCAIYTRKSTEEGLDKEFNTLEAQRESGENYVKSQSYQGWEIIPTRYDDGGFSGGNLNRPALQQLMSDVENGLVDMIVVYKIDRLTRSLVDFAKLVAVLDEHHCSFVSVTQNFNTYDSMGRLTLNVLLSFAQFEREVITERIRDKISASKKKGMWMGGCLPIGYDAVNKKLVVNEAEAAVVRLIFEKYLVMRSEIAVSDWLNAHGYTTMGKTGSKQFNHQRVNKILRNVIYIGKVPHKTAVYDGQHEAIVSQEIFDEVQEIKKTNRGGRLALSRFVEHSLLKGYIYCDCCHSAMVATNSNKKNKVYGYYSSVRVIKEGYKQCQVGNIPAGELDNFILEQMEAIIRSPKIVAGLISEAKNTFTLGRADYQRQYEPILYGWNADKPHYWCGDRDQSDVWEYNKPVKNDLHPTMKPVELVERAVLNSSKLGDIVLDGFGGSGSTLIACEKNNRKARLMELDPKFCDVIVKRWEDYTGKKAQLLENEENNSEIMSN